MDTCDTWWCYFLLALSPVILQGCGVSGTDWVTATSCEALDDKPACCKSNRSSIHSTCHTSFGLGDLQQGVNAMQWIAFMILFIHLLCLPPTIFCGCCDGSCKAFLEGLYLYQIAGLLSLIGCIIFAAEYSGQSFGKSFLLCMASGMYVLFVKCLQKVLPSFTTG